MPGLNPRGEVATERGNCLADAGDRPFDPLGDGRARPLCMRRGAPFLSTESDGRRQLFGDRIHFLLNPGDAFLITKLLCFLQPLPQVL